MGAYVKVFYDWIEQTEALSDAERGRLINAIVLYARAGEVTELSGNERFVFGTFRSAIDRDALLSAKRAKNGSEGGKKSKSKQNEANLSKSKQNEANLSKSKQNEANLSNKDEDKDKDEDEDSPPKPPKGADADGFDEFWQAYPRKAGKGDALRAWKKIKPSAELRSRIAAAIEAAKGCDQWQRENGRFIPNPATWLNQGRWEDDYGAPAPGSKQSEMDELVAEFMRE